MELITDFHIRPAIVADLPDIIALFAADSVGGHGDGWSDVNASRYRVAMDAILANTDACLFVMEEVGKIIGVAQLNVIQTLTGVGALRAVLKSLQIAASHRSQGLGEAMVRYVEERARQRGASSIQLVSSKKRSAAHRFYERIGYARSHEGFSKTL